MLSSQSDFGKEFAGFSLQSQLIRGFGDQTPTIKYYNLCRIATDQKIYLRGGCQTRSYLLD
ncbi:MAG TPA: hypothetical protein DCQ51_21100 [Planktothrix sp. UBA8407]|nr:hypothetical protein [Planktothrix sp. UBA8402]HAO13590.1 hypothetical protein [Planktothrix sp. UBA8407]HBK24756.1 hypothetical protein [Planktothrix sp. UBA10369]